MVIVIDRVSSRLGSWCNIPVAVLGGARVEAIESSLDVFRSGSGS
jgi:hypothetical protein